MKRIYKFQLNATNSHLIIDRISTCSLRKISNQLLEILFVTFSIVAEITVIISVLIKKTKQYNDLYYFVSLVSSKITYKNYCSNMNEGTYDLILFWRQKNQSTYSQITYKNFRLGHSKLQKY